jgi:hypothetical protein
VVALRLALAYASSAFGSGLAHGEHPAYLLLLLLAIVRLVVETERTSKKRAKLS